MLSPEQDVIDRAPIWDSLQMIYMDTDVSLSYDHMVKVCASSKYSMTELDEILYNEVMPAVRFNMLMLPAPEWRGFELEWLKKRVLKKHRFGRPRPIWFRRYTGLHWKKVRPKIEEARRA